MSEEIVVHWDGRRFLVWNSRQAYALRGAHRIVGSAVGALPTNKRQTHEMGLPLSLLFEEALLLAEEGLAEVVDASGLRPEERAAAAVAAAKVAAEGVSTVGESSAGSGTSSCIAAIPTSPGTPAAAPGASQAFPTTGWYAIDGECGEWKLQSASLPRLSPQQLRLADRGQRLLHAQVFRALWSRGFFITCGSTFGADYLCYPGDPMRHHAHLLVHVARPGRPPPTIELSCASRLANSVKKASVLAEGIGDGEVTFSPIEQSMVPLGPARRARQTGRAGTASLALRGKRSAAAVAKVMQDGEAAEADGEAASEASTEVRSSAERAAVTAAKLMARAGAEVEAVPDAMQVEGGQLADGGAIEEDPELPAMPVPPAMASVTLADQVLRAPIDHAPAIPAPKPRERRARAPWESEEVEKGSRRR